MQALGGFSEAAIGCNVAFVCPPLGMAMMTHGSDQFTAGLRTVYYGAPAHTATSQLLQLTGLDPGTAELVDSGLSLMGAGWGGAYIQQCEQIAARAVLKVPESTIVNTKINYLEKQISDWLRG
jgi:hypothetical protein